MDVPNPVFRPKTHTLTHTAKCAERTRKHRTVINFCPVLSNSSYMA